MGFPIVSTGSDFSITGADLFAGPMFIDPSANIVATLPDAVEGVDTYLYHVGASNTITVDLPSTTDLMTVAAGGRCHIQTYTDSSGVPQYVTFATYTLTNVTEDRALDADAAVVAETNDVLATLINDLKKRGIID